MPAHFAFMQAWGTDGINRHVGGNPDGDLYVDTRRFAAGWTRISANNPAAVVVKVGPGILRSVVVNSAGSNTNLVTLRDGATVIGVLKQAPVGDIVYNLRFTTGLSVTMDGGQPADITVTFD